MIAPDKILDRVREVYGEPCPDWLEALAAACDASSQTAVATTLGYSRTVINLVVHGEYDRDMAKVEQAVRDFLMPPVIVTCPVYGAITSAACRSNQALPFSNSNATRVALFRACRRGCPNSGINTRKPEAA